jgi:hypothetical protein
LQIVEDTFLNWKTEDVTLQFYKRIKAMREKIKEDLILGLYENHEFARGKAMCLLEITEMTYEDLLEKVE